MPGSISVRGAGNVNWASLSSSTLNPSYSGFYPSSLSSTDQATAVKNTCKTGYLYNASNTTVNGVPPGQYGPAVADYPLMATSRLPSTLKISNQEAISSPTRGNAKPITYGLSITQNGLLNLSYSYNGGAAIPVITNQSIAASNGAIPANFRFGFSAGTGGASNVHEITCFKAAQLNAASDSAGVNVQQSARVEAGTQVYLAYYHPTNWWGQLTATNLAYNAATDTVSLAALSNWDASCVLTGTGSGSCAATGGTNTAQATGTGAAASGTRQLLTWGLNSSSAPSGVPLQWSNLTTTQQSALASSDLLGYLRGDRSNEIGGSGTNTFRGRTGVLGDIIDSSPTWVGAPSLPYRGPWVDALNPTATQPEGTSYATFASTNATRTNVVYAGANDGIMHAFRAGAYTASGTFDTTAPNDGQELLGYVPSSVLSTIHNATPTLDFSSPSYAHALFVDATPGTGDLYYNGAWHTWLVGGLGAGGNINGPIGDKTTVATGGAIYALDITNPGNFSEANAASLVIRDWRPNSITCFNNTPANCGNNLGNTFGTPIIRRLHDGNWAAIFGNGLNSSTGVAGIYIMTVSQTGVISFRFLSTGAGPSSTGAKNGIAYVSSADLDGDHITDYVYGGDALGNVWRFDLTSSTPATWAAGTTPLFSTPGGQPITTRVTVTSAGAGPSPRVMVDFATGQQLPQTVAGAAAYASGNQSIYGIWDWNMSTWNGLGSVVYASLAAPQSITSANLQTQTATDVAGSSGNISGFRTVTQNEVCWKGSASCSGGASSNTQFGWTLALPDSGEQVIYNPTSAYGLFVVNTTIPAVNQALSCSNQPPSGYTMAISSDTGGAPNQSFFASATNNFLSANGAIVSGIGLSAVGTPSFVSAMTKPFMVNQTASGVGSVTQVNAGANGLGARLNWIKLR
ncbi:MAG: pilus assembly protein PilY [Burkholderiaceae bacterium]|nr:MAG: pilus assembly protein PilY [Burkholderiaceae bacterium]